MRLIVARDHNDLSRKAANILSAQVILKGNAVLGLATGGTVIGIYDQLVDWYRKGDIDFSNVHTVNLDEYVGLAESHPQSYHRFMKDHFFTHINIPDGNVHIPDGMAADLDLECKGYDHLIERLGGIDIQLLGLGMNGHIGFNEPGESFAQYTHCVALEKSTRKANARFFDLGEAVPETAITMGIKSIMQAKRILLCVSGTEKAPILRQVLFGPVTPEIPGSILQMHPQLTVVTDFSISAD